MAVTGSIDLPVNVHVNVDAETQQPEEFRQELLPLANGERYVAEVKFPSDPGTFECPVLAWVVYWFTNEADYGHPMTVEPLFFVPVEAYSDDSDPDSYWQSEWDDGCAVTPTNWNHGRIPADRMKWRVIRRG
jgi:hypothetical protein